MKFMHFKLWFRLRSKYFSTFATMTPSTEPV